MRRISFVFLAALCVVMALDALLGAFVPKELGVLRTIIVFAPFPLIISLAVLTVLAMLSGDPNNLWESRYFKFMRGFCGSMWGGKDDEVEWVYDTYGSPEKKHRTRPRSISVCSATWLSAGALIWTLACVCCFVLFALAMVAEWTGNLTIAISSNADDIGNVVATHAVAGLFSGFVFTLLSIPVWYGVHGAFPKSKDLSLEVTCVIGGFWVVTQLTVAQIRIFGFEVYLQWVEGILAALLSGTIIVGLLVLLLRSGILGKIWANTWRTISTRSVPVILVREHRRGLKEKFCPIIRENIST